MTTTVTDPYHYFPTANWSEAVMRADFAKAFLRRAQVPYTDRLDDCERLLAEATEIESRYTRSGIPLQMWAELAATVTEFAEVARVSAAPARELVLLASPDNALLSPLQRRDREQAYELLAGVTWPAPEDSECPHCHADGFATGQGREHRCGNCWHRYLAEESPTGAPNTTPALGDRQP